MRRVLIAIVLAMLVAAAGGAYWYRSQVITGLVTAAPQRGPAIEAVYATGTVESSQTSEVAPVVAGQLVEVNANEGDMVAAGDILARIDDRAERAKVSELEARVRYYSEEAGRLTRLFASGAVSTSKRDEAIFQRDAAISALEAARARLNDHVLRAPITGVVLKRDGDPGDTVAAGKTVFIIGNPRLLRIKADVDEADILRVRKGQTALVRADALGDKVVRGTLSEITPLGDSLARTYEVRIRLPADTGLLAGMTVEVNIIVRQNERALLVPEGALDGSTVWVVRDGRARRVAVKTGVVGNGKAEILSGLKGDEEVIVARPKRLKEGMRVKPSLFGS